MAERTVMLRLGLNISGVLGQARAAGAAMADLASKVEKGVTNNSASVDLLSNHLAGVGVALVGVAGLAVQRFADFDKAMSSVRASTRATGSELEALRNAAVQAGADTAFSASEAAQGIDELAKAGVATEDILGGGLAGALNLAAAGQISVAEAAETAASAMVQFGLEGSDVGHVADLLAAGAGKAQGSVSDMGQALNQAGLIASQVGLSVEETTGSLAAMASAGLMGSDAGTSLKTALIALSSPSSTAAKEMKRLGISAYDANGEFIGMEALAGQLQDRLGGLTDEQRNSALATIFGSDALRTANVLYTQGAAGIAEWTDKVNDTGYAAETAHIQTDNLAGDLERLGGAIDTALIQSGSGANDAMRGLVQGAEGVVDAFGRIPAPVLSATGLIAGAGGLALLGIAGMGKLAVGVTEARAAVEALGISTKTASIAAGALGGAIAVGTLAFTAWAQAAAEAEARTEGYMSTLDELGNRTDSTVRRINEALSANQNDWLDNLFGDDPESIIDRAARIGLAIEDLQGYILGEADAVEKVTAATEAYIRQQGEATTPGEVRAQASRLLTGVLDEEAASLTDAEKAAAQKARADEAAGVAAEAAAEATQSATSATQENTEAVEENWQAQLDAAGAVLSMRDAQNQAEASYDAATESLKNNGKTLDVTTEKGRANRSALDGIAESGWDLIDSMRANGASQSDLQKTMSATRDRFIDVASSMGLSKSQARALADELGLIPKDVKPKVAVIDNASGKIRGIRSEIESLRDRTITVTTIRREAFRRAGIDDNRNRAGFGSGGFTGVGGKWEEAGPVHRGEWVIRQESTRSLEAAYPGLLGALNQHGAAALGRGYADGGPVMTARQYVTPPMAPSAATLASVPSSSRSLVVNNYGRDLSARELVHAQRVMELNEPEVFA